MSNERRQRAIGGAVPAVRFAVRSAPGWSVVQVAVTVAAAVLPVASVWLLKALLDDLTRPGRTGLPASAYLLAGAGVLAGVLPALTTYVRNEVGRVVGRRAMSELYQATSRLAGLGRLEDTAFRDRLRMAQQSGRTGPGAVFDGLLGIAQGVITLAGLVAVLAAVSPLMAGLVVLGGVPALVAQLRLSRQRAAMMWGITPAERREFFYAELMTSLPAAKEVRLLGLFELFRGRMIRELRGADAQRRRMDGRDLRAQVVLVLLAGLVSGGGLIWAVHAASTGRLGIGDVSAFVAAVSAVQTGISMLVMKLAGIHQSLLLYDHFRAVLRAEPDLVVRPDARPVPPLRTGIELRDVWFRYGPDQPWVLRGVDLVIPHGRAVALVGLNGAGKSTLVKLLCRFYDPQRGQVLWDGVDIRELSVESLRERIGAVFQDYMSYDLPAAENVGLGDVAALDDRARIRRAAQRAGIDEKLAGLPRGYDTMLSRMFPDTEDGQAGVLLSGGQWQRVALARAFLRDKRDLLILDEPSSGLDALAEYEIHHRLREHRADATSLLISHRLGAVRDADEVVVLADGAVLERGRHDELIAAGGEYARLFRMQADGYREPAQVPA